MGKDQIKSGPSWGRSCTWASDLVVSEQRTYGNRQTAALEPGSNGGGSDEVYVVYSYCTRHKHKRRVARECQFSGKRVWAIPWGYVGVAQLLGPYVAIPGSRQSDDVAARYASGQMRFQGAGWGVCASPTGGPQGQLQTACSATGTAISLAVLVWWAQSKQPAHGHDSLARLL